MEQGSSPSRPSIALSQSKRDGGCGVVDYIIVVTHPDATELVHEYCSYHPMAGPVRPDAVKELRLDGDKVKWFWSENAYDKASPGAYFERRLTLENAKLAWAGPAVREPIVRAQVVPPTVAAEDVPAGRDQEARVLRLEDMQVESKWWREYDDKVAIHCTHAPTGLVLVWDGTSDAENQAIDRLKTSVTENGLLHIEFVYRTSENGDHHALNFDLFVKLGADGLEWVKA